MGLLYCHDPLNISQLPRHELKGINNRCLHFTWKKSTKNLVIFCFSSIPISIRVQLTQFFLIPIRLHPHDLTLFGVTLAAKSTLYGNEPRLRELGQIISGNGVNQTTPVASRFFFPHFSSYSMTIYIDSQKAHWNGALLGGFFPLSYSIVRPVQWEKMARGRRFFSYGQA